MTEISQLVQALKNPALYPHSVKNLHIIETHISYVILTGTYAYKIKKPLNLGFLDFSSLSKRQFYCEEELRLNKRYAPELYLSVIPITGTVENPVWQGKGDVIEYAIQMQEFSQRQLFSNLLKTSHLTSDLVITLAKDLSALHENASIAGNDVHYGLPEQLFFFVRQNFDQIRPLINSSAALKQMESVEAWSNQAYQRLYALFFERKSLEFIRECHGDLHLGNIVLYQNKPMIFDSLEFNSELRWTDTMADVGFLSMDLIEKERPDLAMLFLNTYFTVTGDYAGLQLLSFYQCYRAVVRAKVALFQKGACQNAQEAQRLEMDYARGMALAERFATEKKLSLIIMHGISGSGKTTLASKMAPRLEAIHIRSDVERKRSEQFSSTAYTLDARQKNYDKLAFLAEQILCAGYSVIVDATFLKKIHRDTFAGIANKYGATFNILACEVDDKTCFHRLEERGTKYQDYSDADYLVAQQQRQYLEPLTEEELLNIMNFSF